jgi:endonuclease/exonuclease/phosphatase family metal-dependent hydrolase
VKTKVVTFAAWLGCFFVSGLVALTEFHGQSNLTVRVMAANTTSGNFSSYQDPGIRIFQGLQPDIVAIQEFRYNASATDAQLRQLVDTAFGPEFYYYREPYTDGGDIPNGIISRWPISAAGSWDDLDSPNRGFAWAQIDLPGTNDLYVVSVHLLTASSSVRGSEAAQLKALIATNFPATAWIIVAGDMNTDSRTETAMNTFKTFLSDSPVPTDAESGGNEDTNANRNKPYDYVLPNFPLTNHLIPVALPSRTFPKGLVFDSRVYTPLSDVAPVQSGDSGVSGMQHMAVIKDFSLPVGVAVTNPPTILTQPQSQTNSIGSLVEFTVSASGTAPLVYQWRFNNATLSGANTSSFTITNAQSTNAGDYTVVITNVAGSVTSAIAALTISSDLAINSQPQNLSVAVGENASFSVTASGAAPLHYQWRFNSSAISSATNSTYTRTNAQLADAGNYTVVITNANSSVTSSVAVLIVNDPTVGGTNLVISQIYGGGGNSSATYRNDFVELFNPTPNPISVTGWTIQYASATGTSWQTGALNGVIPAYRYYLIQFASGGATGSLIPTADATSGINISASQGKLALVNSTSGLSGSNPVGGATIVDFVGYGSANAFEGTGTAPGAPSSNNTTSILRKDGGLTDSNNNADDFITTTPPEPRNSSSPANPPIVPPVPAVAPTLTNAFWSGTKFQFLLTGTTGSNYVVQSTTNLNAPTWIPLRTNAAPFIYVETNLPTTQRFYRGMVAP